MISPPLVLKKFRDFYTISLFEEFGLRALFTTRSFDFRKRTYREIGLSMPRLVRPSQVHGDSVFIVGGNQRDRSNKRGRGLCGFPTAFPEADALITKQRGLPLAILTADCLPVFIFDPVQRVIAMVHAGWRGLSKKIIVKTIQRMAGNFSTRPKDLVVVLGPAIRSCCYEVSRDFLGVFKNGISQKGNRFYFDIPAAAGSQLAGVGLRREFICDSRICTHCMNHEFFSFRREGVESGRSLSAMEIL